MSTVTRVHGDFKPVANVDSADYVAGAVNAVTQGAVVNLAGPKLDFFTVTQTDVGVDGAKAAAAIAAVQTASTIAIYEFVDDDTLALAVFPAGAFTTATLAAVIGGGATAAAGATFGA